jgi:hypothetical protein
MSRKYMALHNELWRFFTGYRHHERNLIVANLQHQSHHRTQQFDKWID